MTSKQEKEPPRSGQSSRRRRGDPSLLSTKQPILVTVTKEPYHSKSSRLSTDISLAGRFLVLIPFAGYAAVSRRIKDRKERYRLRSIVKRLRPSGFGLIARTVAKGRKEDVLETGSCCSYITQISQPGWIHAGPLICLIRHLYSAVNHGG